LCIIPNSARNDYAFNKTDLFEKYKLDNVSYMVFMFYTLCVFTILNDLNENNFKIDYLSSFCEKKIEKIKQDISSENINEKYNWDFNGLVKIWEEWKHIFYLFIQNPKSSTFILGFNFIPLVIDSISQRH
jgi:hypothetical protein